jgi:class 3 adenylate cyclase/pimeloyl-ACP methyl ester carboxylesterase
LEQEIRYCTSFDGTRIAYATLGGRNKPPLVRVATWLTHLEFDWESPVLRPWLNELSRDFFIVRYDPRGCGLSDRNVREISFGAWVRDLEEVVAAAGLERFTLLGLSQGGPVGIEYSLRHPERVKQLILWGAFSVGWIRRGLISEEERNALLTLTKEGWGRNSPAYRAIFTNLFMPDASEEQMHWFNDLQRKSMSGKDAARYLIEAGNVDIAEKLSAVTTPTLVVHAREDSLVRYEEGRFLAASIPNARLVTLESKNHIILEKEPSWPKAFHEIRTFCGIADGAAAPTAAHVKTERRLAVLMFADMVGYTALAQKDESLALDTVKELRALLRPIFSEFGGREVKTMGDAFLVEFGSALEAARCALRIQRTLRTRSKDERVILRVGIHLGDVEEEGGDILGDAVNIASRLEPLASPGSVYISQQVYDQIRNRGEFSFNNMGKQRLKNIEEPLAVYEVMEPAEKDRH